MSTDGGESGLEWQRLYSAQLELRDALADEPDPARWQDLVEQVRVNNAAIEELESSRGASNESEAPLAEHVEPHDEFDVSGNVSGPVGVEELLAALDMDEPQNDLVSEDPMSTPVEPDLAPKEASEEPSPSEGRSRLAAAVVGGFGALVLLGLATALWLLVTSDGASLTTTEEPIENEAATSTDVEAQATELRGVLARLGLSETMVDVRDSKLYVVGSVSSEQDLSAVRSAVVGLPSSTIVDLTELVVDEVPADTAAPLGDAPLPPPGGGRPPPGAPPPGGPLPPGVEPPSAEQQAALQQELDDALLGTPLVFDPGSTTLNAQQLELLDTVIIDILESHPGVPVNLVGYTDESGGEYENQLLSFERASAVRDYLLSRGVPDFIVRAEGRGEDDPSGDSGADRRVEIKVDLLD